MLKWILALGLSACGGFSQPASQPATVTSPSASDLTGEKMSELQSLFADVGLTASDLQVIFWPEDAGRYAGILRRIQVDFPRVQTQGDFRTRLQDLLIPWLEAQQHPEAQCVSVEMLESGSASAARFLLEIVCR